MKRIFSLLLMLFMLVGCSDATVDTNFLTQGTWLSKTTSTELTFCNDGSLHAKNFLFPTEYFRYSETEKRIDLLDKNKSPIASMSIIYSDNAYMVAKLGSQTFVFENQAAELTNPHVQAKQYIDTESKTLPYLTVLSCQEGALTVSSADYDADAKNSFETWTLALDLFVSKRSVSVHVKNDNVQLDVAELTDADMGLFGENYTHAFLEFDSDGDVVAINFYGETIAE